MTKPLAFVATLTAVLALATATVSADRVRLRSGQLIIHSTVTGIT